jgi:D-alanyl-D-alanine carboxypeptidase
MSKYIIAILIILNFLPAFAGNVFADTFSYNQPRVRNIQIEQDSALALKPELKTILNIDQIPISSQNWSTVVNSFIYGQYPAEAIAATIYYGGKTVHPTISWEQWQKTEDYNIYLKKFKTREQFSVGSYNEDVITDDKLSAVSAIAIDAQNGEVLYGKNIDQSLPIASLSKLMSAIIFLENNPGWDKIITYSAEDDDVLSYAERREMAYLKINIGDQIKVEDLFYTGLVGSANNSIYALARSTGLSREEFVKKMNDKAQEWGLDKTYFFEPSGLSPQNVSSAKDFAKIAYYAFTDENIRKATSYKYWEFRTINDNKYHKVKSINNLLQKKLSFKIKGTKTGYLEEAKRCLVAKGEKEGREVIALVLGGENVDYFNEVEKLIKDGLGV